jgi:hypothetical protein
MRISYLLLGSVIFLILALSIIAAWLLVVAPGALDPRFGPRKSTASSVAR